MKRCISVLILLLLLRPVVPETDSSGASQPTSTQPTSSTARTTASTTATRSTTPRPQFAQETTLSPTSTQNCTKPVRVSNQFDMPGLAGWDLTSHADYFNNSASMHEVSLNCQWCIARQDGLITLIRITSLLLEASPSCNFDALTLEFVELNSNYSVGQNFCGSVENKVMLAVSDISITFKTDSSVNSRGFHLQWAFVNASFAQYVQNVSHLSLCTKPEDLSMITIAGISAPGERLVSHEDFDEVHRRGVYRNNQNCRWTLTPKKQYIMLWIKFVQLEYSGSESSIQLCSYDNLTVHFTDAITGQPFNSTICTPTRDRVYLSNSSIEVIFRTDSSVGSRGFAIEWLHLNDTQANVLRQSWNTFTNETQSPCMEQESLSNMTLQGVGTFAGGQLTSHSEYLSISSSNYRPNLNCRWTIPIPNNFTLIHFKVVSLDLEVSSVPSSECRFDNLTVEYHDVLTDRRLSKVACKSLHLAYFTSKGDVIVKFVTDRSVSKRGFHLVWFFVSLRDAYKLPGLGNMQSFNCPEVDSPEHLGGFSVDLSQPIVSCMWQWFVNQGQTINITALYLKSTFLSEISRLESHGPFGPCCQFPRKLLSISSIDANGRSVVHCLCANSSSGFTVIAFPGPVSIKIRSATPMRGHAEILYSVHEEPVFTNCTAPRAMSKYSVKISDRISRNIKIECGWTVQPLDENHGVKVKVARLDLLHHRARYNYIMHPSRDPIAMTMVGTDCSCVLRMTTSKRFSIETLRNWTRMVQSNAPPSDASLQTTLSRCCGRREILPFYPPPVVLGMDEITSLGPVSINLNFSRRPMIDLAYEIEVQHFPVAKPGSNRLCSVQQAVSTKHTLVEQLQGGRLIAVKQVTIASGSDCITSALLNANQPDIISNSDVIRVSVNCTQSGGHINVVKDDLATISLNCSNASISYPWINRIPVTLQAVETGGFTAVLEHIILVLDIGVVCPSYTATNNAWRVNLPLYRIGHNPIINMKMFYCTMSMAPTPGHELIVRLQMPYSNDNQEQFCSKIGSLQYQPKLSFIISAPNRDNQIKLSLCDHNSPGGLRLQQRIRVSEGESLTIDLTVAAVAPQSDGNEDSDPFTEGLQPDSRVDALVLVDRVEVCERLPSSGEQWQVSPDGTQLLSTVTVAPNNTQTDCKLQLDAFTAADIANQSKTFKSAVSKLSTVGCWDLEVKLDKFSTVCGLKQLVLTVSHWDSLAASIEHSQREICSSDLQFSSQSVSASLQAAGSGLSLQYSGVRSGFRARFSISACRESSVRNEQLVDSPVIAGSVSPALTAVLVILALCNVFIVLFIFRARIFYYARLLASRSQRSRQLIYRTGADAVNLVNEDT